MCDLLFYITVVKNKTKLFRKFHESLYIFVLFFVFGSWEDYVEVGYKYMGA